MNERTKALRIPRSVKSKVFERDNRRCILCGSWKGQPNAHYISRAQSGLGIEQNVVTLCYRCHMDYDQSPARSYLKSEIRQYLQSVYPDWDESRLVYRKGDSDGNS